jgi:hypothetical protein
MLTGGLEILIFSVFIPAALRHWKNNKEEAI